MLAVAEAEVSRPDGIAFDWYVSPQCCSDYAFTTNLHYRVSDLTAQGESLRSLLSVYETSLTLVPLELTSYPFSQGIRSADLDKVLSRAVTHTGRASTLEPPKAEPPQNAQLRFNASAPPGSQLLPGNAWNPIVIHKDDDEPEIMGTSVLIPDRTLRSPHAQMTQIFASGPSSATDVSVASTSAASPSKQQAPDVPCSPEHNVAGPSRLSNYGSGTPEYSKTAERYGSVESEVATSLTYVRYAYSGSQSANVHRHVALPTTQRQW